MEIFYDVKIMDLYKINRNGNRWFLKIFIDFKEFVNE